MQSNLVSTWETPYLLLHFSNFSSGIAFWALLLLFLLLLRGIESTDLRQTPENTLNETTYGITRRNDRTVYVPLPSLIGSRRRPWLLLNESTWMKPSVMLFEVMGNYATHLKNPHETPKYIHHFKWKIVLPASILTWWKSYHVPLSWHVSWV